MIHSVSIFIVMGITILFSCGNFIHLAGTTYAQSQTNNTSETAGQKVSFLTDDGVLIVGTYYSSFTSHHTAAIC